MAATHCVVQTAGMCSINRSGKAAGAAGRIACPAGTPCHRRADCDILQIQRKAGNMSSSGAVSAAKRGLGAVLLYGTHSAGPSVPAAMRAIRPARLTVRMQQERPRYAAEKNCALRCVPACPKNTRLRRHQKRRNSWRESLADTVQLHLPELHNMHVCTSRSAL